MADRIQQERTEALDRQTGAFVWNAIRYLDSPSSYREYLPCAHRSALLENSELILLDDLSQNCWVRARKITLIAACVCMVLLPLLRS